MNISINTNQSYFYLLLACLLSSACVKRDLEERPQQGAIEIDLAWGESVHPQEARYLFYNESGKLVKEETNTAGCFKGTLPTGTYHVVIHNSDARQVGYRGMDNHETAEVYALEAPTARTAADQPQVLEPQTVYGTSSCQGFGKLVVETGKSLRRTATPKLLTRQVKFRFTVINAKEVEALSGKLNGVAPGLFIASGKSNFAHMAATTFTGVPGQENTYTIDLQVFDLLSSEQPSPEANTMDISLAADGKKYELSTDLTQALEQIMEENGGTIPVEIPIEVEITVKEAIGKITATVKPWDESGTGSGTVQ